MVIRYKYDEELHRKTLQICEKLFPHVKLEHVSCIRSYGSKSKYTIARCHALGKALQTGMQRKGFYTIEFVSENFDKLSEEEKIKVIIHEIMHIPKSFGGGFRYHDYVCDKNIGIYYNKLKEVKGDFSDNENKKKFGIKGWW